MKNKLNVSRGLKTVKALVTANSPVLLVGATITGVLATGVLAARAGYKARGIVDHAQAAQEEPLTTQEKVSLTWLCYAPAAITGVSTITSCMGLHFVHTKRFAEMAGLYAITSGKLDDYKEEAEKLLGSKKSQQLNDVMGQKSADETPFVNNEVYLTEGGTQMCHDDWTGRWFMSNMNLIDAAVNECNAILIDNGDLELNTFYDRIGLPPVPQGTDLGWSGDKIGIIYGNINTKEGVPALSISFRSDPKPNLGRA
jgi:hypothetical protein